MMLLCARAYRVVLRAISAREDARMPANGRYGSGRQARRECLETLESRALLDGVSFGPARTFDVGAGPIALCMGDFNGDGKSDIASANGNTNTISVLLGNGDGTFGSRTDYTVGSAPSSLAVSDFNGDGKSDIAAAVCDSNVVSIFLGNGNGTFQARRDIGTVGPWAICAGDLNGDGKGDLATTGGDDTVRVLLGNGDGTFHTASVNGVGSGPTGLAVGDFNGDGISDLVSANYVMGSSVSVLLGNGDGTYQTANNYAGLYPLSVATGDFNNDEVCDIAMANASDSTVGILLSNGDGTFDVTGNFGVDPYIASLAVGYFNNDEYSDIVTASYISNTVNILLGNGDGTFGSKIAYGVGSSTRAVMVGDFNGDGLPDIAAANAWSNNVSILLHDSVAQTMLSPASIPENRSAGTEVGTFSVTGANGGAPFTYALVSGAGDNASFAIVGDRLFSTASFDYETKSGYQILVRTSDSGGMSFEQTFTITVTNVNEAPTDVALSATSIAENQPTGTIVGIFSSTDSDAGDTYSYALADGPGSTDNASFTIYGSTLQTAASFDFETSNSYSIRVRATDQGGLWYEKVFTINVTDVDDTAPTVTAVYVRGSTWSSGYLSFLAGNLPGSSSSYGYAIPSGSGAAQLQTLPWRNLNQISLRFSEDVLVSQAQFAIVGSVGSYSVSGFSYSSADHVATWSLAAAIGPDKLYVAVPGSGSSAVRDAAGNVLDGEWNNPASYVQLIGSDTFPSGDGTAGGDFAFRFDVLPGDSSGGSLGKVNVADALQSKGRSGLPVSTSTYRSDFDGNSLVNVADVLYVKSKSSVYSLPVNPPVVPVFGSVFSQVDPLLSREYLLLGYV